MSPRARRSTRRARTEHPNGAIETVFSINDTAAPTAAAPRRQRTRQRARSPAIDGTGMRDTPGRRRQHQANPIPEVQGAVLNPVQPNGIANDQPASPQRPPCPTVEEVPKYDDPFTSAAPPATPRVNFRLPDEDEFIDLPSSPSTPVPTTTAQSGRQIGAPTTPRSRGSPRTGRHSASRSQQCRNSARSPAGNAKRHTAKDVWTFFEKDGEKRYCKFCQQQRAANASHIVNAYGLGTSTGGLRKHLYLDHLDSWVLACDHAGLKITAKEAQEFVTKFRQRHGNTLADGERRPSAAARPYSPEAFVDAIIEWIIADDQSLNAVESPQLRSIFLMLRDELKDSDIPHRTTIRNRVTEVWEAHLDWLEAEMKDAMGKVSLTTDLWSDTNLSPFMAVTAHWIEGKSVPTPNGDQYVLKLRSDLIGFHRVPGRHSGDHLAQAFIFITDRIQLTPKIGWVTLDNASNNDTFTSFLEFELRQRGIVFDRCKNRIRCFPHIVNLACKAVLGAITNMEFASETAPDYNPDDASMFRETLDRDPIATIRTVVRVTRASSYRRQCLSEIVQALYQKDLQLLRDVDTRWSSTLLMIERATLLRTAIDSFLRRNEFADLKKYQLTTAEWNVLDAYKLILSVPHAFQQKLSAEKTPTLCDTIPCYEAMSKKWESLQAELPALSTVIQQGLDKLEVYRDRAEVTPAYVLALFLNPNIKLKWHMAHQPDKVAAARELLIQELRQYYAPATPATPGRRRRNSQVRTPAIQTSWADDILGMEAPTVFGQYVTLEQEVNAYLAEVSRPTGILMFWQENQLQLPTLFALAMDILPIQGSSVPCERVFSSGKETMSARRNRISPELMECLQMLKFSIKQGRGLDFTHGTSKDNEYSELEALNVDRSAIPEDVAAFARSLVL
ncbi:Zinc finger BED domain-containing [Pleurotus pulmonarius]